VILVVVAAMGWAVALGLVVLLRRRLSLLADAEHELRGGAAAVGLATEQLARAGITRPFAQLIAVQLDRLGAGLDDLARVRRRPFATGAAAGAAPSMDSARLAQVVTNLVANAAEHGTGPIDVRWNPTRGGARLEIRNRNRPRALDELAEGRAAGRGRGLGIAGRAARELGGSLAVIANAEKTVASLELPERGAGTGRTEDDGPPLAA
jgi:signal transduction histidine kinase